MKTFDEVCFLYQKQNTFKSFVDEVQSDARADLLQRNAALEAALRKIATYDEQSIWMDDRDDAADGMLEIAREAIK